MKKESSNDIEWNDVSNIWRSFNVNSSYFNQSKHIDNIPFATDLLGVNPTLIYILNCLHEGYDYISDNITQLFGYGVEEYKNFDLSRIVQSVHPEDVQYVMKAEMAFLEMCLSVKPEERKLLKSSIDFRFQCKDGKFIHILQQKIILELTPEGNPALIMAMISDVSFMKKNTCSFSISLFQDNKVWKDITPEVFKTENNLSKREREILKMLIKGLPSKVIADKLNISFHTVNNHRKNLLQKTKCQNTAELIGYAISNGIN